MKNKGTPLKNSSEQEPRVISPPKHKRVEYTVRIGNHLFQRITRHMVLLKHLKDSESKQKWIQEAIEEKLSSDKNSGKDPGDKFLHIKLDVELWEALNEKVELLRASHISMSKKLFIEEAIFEKLDREEHKSKSLLKNMLNLSSVE